MNCMAVYVERGHISLPVSKWHVALKNRSDAIFKLMEQGLYDKLHYSELSKIDKHHMPLVQEAYNECFTTEVST